MSKETLNPSLNPIEGDGKGWKPVLLALLNVLHWIGVVVIAGVLLMIAFVLPGSAKELKVPVGRMRSVTLRQAKKLLFSSLLLVAATGFALTYLHRVKLNIPLYEGLIIGKVLLTALIAGNLWFLGRGYWERKQQKRPDKIIAFNRNRSPKRVMQYAVFNLAGVGLLLMFAAFLREL
ncbi:MAG TPA: hypothetical protein VFV52_03700 [Bacilli bacterium]|nr:hypothetical protein [Bacilli bacterium]